MQNIFNRECITHEMLVKLRAAVVKRQKSCVLEQQVAETDFAMFTVFKMLSKFLME